MARRERDASFVLKWEFSESCHEGVPVAPRSPAAPKREYNTESREDRRMPSFCAAAPFCLSVQDPGVRHWFELRRRSGRLGRSRIWRLTLTRGTFWPWHAIDLSVRRTLDYEILRRFALAAALAFQHIEALFRRHRICPRVGLGAKSLLDGRVGHVVKAAGDGAISRRIDRVVGVYYDGERAGKT